MFTKARYEYVRYLIDSYEKNNELLERKSNFLFSIISIFVVGIFFQFEKIGIAIYYLNRKPVTAQTILISGGILILVGISISTFFVLNSIRIRSFLPYFPANPLSTLFSPQSNFFHTKHTEEDFYNEMGELLIGRLEHNFAILQEKAKNIKYGWVSLSITILLLVIFATLFAFIINS